MPETKESSAMHTNSSDTLSDHNKSENKEPEIDYSDIPDILKIIDLNSEHSTYDPKPFTVKISAIMEEWRKLKKKEFI